MMGTGPLTFVEYVSGSHWVGKKNPNYWDKGKPYLDGYPRDLHPGASAQVVAVRGERAHDPVPRLHARRIATRWHRCSGRALAVQESPGSAGCRSR